MRKGASFCLKNVVSYQLKLTPAALSGLMSIFPFFTGFRVASPCVVTDRPFGTENPGHWNAYTVLRATLCPVKTHGK